MSTNDSKPALLIVEDDAALLRQLRWTFDDYAVATASDRRGAVERLEGARFPVVLLDLGLPPDADGFSEGLSLLREILARAPETKVIVVTGREERQCALTAVELGAYDFYRKPVDADEIRFLVARGHHLHRLEQENRRLARAASREPLPGIVATSEAMARVCRLVEKAAAGDISVLFIGESGTGKEVLARALHLASARANGAFVAINCAAIPEHLLESELFGHERGAFTGAVRQSVGQFELARGGTLFLDEIADMPLALQAKVLRFLQQRLIRRVGGRSDIPVDTRVVSATHRDPRSLIEQGAFREDLYYRISELSVEVPPLRERPEDMVLLAHHFFEQYRKEAERPLQRLTPEAVTAIVRHNWPGNVRELENRMKRAVVIAEGCRVTPRDLDLAPPEVEEPISFALKEALEDAERRAFVRAWAAAEGNVSRASKLLGVSRPTVYKFLQRYGVRT